MRIPKYTLQAFNTQFPDDETCLNYLVMARWPEGILCPKCGKITKHYLR